MSTFLTSAVPFMGSSCYSMNSMSPSPYIGSGPGIVAINMTLEYCYEICDPVGYGQWFGIYSTFNSHAIFRF